MIELVIYYILKTLVILLCISSIMVCAYSAKESYNSNRYNNEDYAGIAMAILYLGFDWIGITLGPEDSIKSAIIMKFFVIIMSMYVIKVSLRNVRQIKLIPENNNIETIKYSGIDRRKHEA